MLILTIAILTFVSCSVYFRYDNKRTEERLRREIDNGNK